MSKIIGNCSIHPARAFKLHPDCACHLTCLFNEGVIMFCTWCESIREQSCKMSRSFYVCLFISGNEEKYGGKTVNELSLFPKAYLCQN